MLGGDRELADLCCATCARTRSARSARPGANHRPGSSVLPASTVRSMRTTREPDHDAALMRAFASRDRNAADTLYARFASRIYGLGIVMLGSDAAAQDLVQDTFVKRGATPIGTTPPEASSRPGCCWSPGPLAIDSLRRRVLEVRSLEATGRPREADPGAGPEEIAETGDMVARARRAMEQALERRAAGRLGAGLLRRQDQHRGRRAGRDPRRHRQDADPHGPAQASRVDVGGHPMTTCERRPRTSARARPRHAERGGRRDGPPSPAWVRGMPRRDVGARRGHGVVRARRARPAAARGTPRPCPRRPRRKNGETDEAPEPTRRRTLSWLAVAAAVAIVVTSVGVRAVPREPGGVGRRQRAQLRAAPAHPRRQGLPRRRAPCGGCPPRGGQRRDLRLQRRSIVGASCSSARRASPVRRSRRCMPPTDRTIDTWPVAIDRDGDGYGWLVTSVDLESFDRVTLTGPDGQPLAAGEIDRAVTSAVSG